ncbi:hypothetical protein GCM10009664_41860 [Kitasatospora gansuensis]
MGTGSRTGLWTRHCLSAPVELSGRSLAPSPARDARTGRNHGLAVTRVRTEDGRELGATESLTHMGSYLAERP